MKLLYAHERINQEATRSIFLAGPSPRGHGEYDWRKQARIHLHRLGFDGVLYIPLPRDGVYQKDYDHTAQMEWELEHLEKARAIVFWIPRDLETLPGFTTNVEFGRFSRSGHTILGYPESAPKMKYLAHIAKIDDVPIFHTMEDTLKAAMDMLPA